MMKKTGCASLLLASFSLCAQDRPPSYEPPPPAFVNNAGGQFSRWSGIGRIKNAVQALCTASLLDTRASNGAADGPAYIVTSSRCLHPEQRTVQKNQPITGTVSFNYFDDSIEDLKLYKLKTLNWSSGIGIDLAIIELEQPLAKLLAEGIQPLKLAEQEPAAQSDILALGIPEWTSLQVSACQHLASVEILEQPWVWRSALKNRCRGISPGSFGGPLLERTSGRLFGVLATTTHDSGKAKQCLAGSPCEITQGHADWQPASNYGSSLVFLNDCFANGRLSADSTSCDLYPSISIAFDNPDPIQQYFVANANGERTITPNWRARPTLNTPFYRFKTVRKASACENADGYGPAQPSENALIDQDISPQPGIHMLCILGTESPTQQHTPAQLKGALTLAVELAEPGPARAPDMSVELDRTLLGSYAVTWRHYPPFYARYEYKYGPAHSTDCRSNQDFVQIPPEYEEEVDELILPKSPDEPPTISKTRKKTRIFVEDLPQGQYKELFSVYREPIKVCTRTYDQANQVSPVRVDILRPR